MKYFLAAVYLLLNLSAYSQETKFILINTPDYNEEFYVLKSNNNVKHGTYVKYTGRDLRIHVLESGEYQDGEKSGLWEYFYETPFRYSRNSIKEKGNYVNGRKNGVWTTYYLDTIPDTLDETRFGNKSKPDSVTVSIDRQSSRLKTAGMYLNDKRVRVWTAFDYSGYPFQKYDFSKQKLLLDLSLKDSVNYNINRVPVFIGGLPQLVDLLLTEFNFEDLTSKIRKDSTAVIVSFLVDKNGHVSEIKIDKTSGHKTFDDEAMRLIALTDNYWIPALLNGEKVDKTYKFQFFVKRKIVSSKGKNFTASCKPIFD